MCPEYGVTYLSGRTREGGLPAPFFLKNNSDSDSLTTSGISLGNRWVTARWPIGSRISRPGVARCDSALKSRRRAVGLLPSLGLLENGARRRAARTGRVCRRDRLGHRDLHRHQRRAAAAAALPEQRALRVAVRLEYVSAGPVHGDVGSRAARLPAADNELRRVRLVPRRPIPPDGAWRAAIRRRRGGDARPGAATRSTAPRPVVR